MLWPGMPLAEALGTKQHEQVLVLVLVQANRLASPRKQSRRREVENTYLSASGTFTTLVELNILSLRRIFPCIYLVTRHKHQHLNSKSNNVSITSINTVDQDSLQIKSIEKYWWAQLAHFWVPFHQSEPFTLCISSRRSI